jgi:hypothetical protein
MTEARQERSSPKAIVRSPHASATTSATRFRLPLKASSFLIDGRAMVCRDEAGYRVSWQRTVLDSLQRRTGATSLRTGRATAQTSLQTDHFEITLPATSREIDIRKLSLR